MIESKNLILRETTFDDCMIFADWECREDVSQYLSVDSDHSYEDIVKEFFTNMGDESKRYFTIVLKSEEKVIGRVYLSKINIKLDSLDLTRIYIEDENYRNKGYGEEAIRAILEYAFINLHMERVTIDHFADNETAHYLYRKIGFEDEGKMRHSGKKDGKYYDMELMSMLRVEYYDKIHLK